LQEERRIENLVGKGGGGQNTLKKRIGIERYRSSKIFQFGPRKRLGWQGGIRSATCTGAENESYRNDDETKSRPREHLPLPLQRDSQVRYYPLLSIPL
jgi:hypothetical protein